MCLCICRIDLSWFPALLYSFHVIDLNVLFCKCVVFSFVCYVFLLFDGFSELAESQGRLRTSREDNGQPDGSYVRLMLVVFCSSFVCSCLAAAFEVVLLLLVCCSSG